MPDKTAMRLGAIILAGGHSTRMGRPKESLPFGNSTLLGTVATTLAHCCELVVVVTRDATQPLPPLPPNVARTHDTLTDRGPLAGLAAGCSWLQHQGLTATDAAFATACDHAFVTPPVVTLLAQRLGQHDALIPRNDGHPQPLCAVYRLHIATLIPALLARGESSLRSLLSNIDAQFVDAEELRGVDPGLRSLMDLDTPAAYQRALRELIL